METNNQDVYGMPRIGDIAPDFDAVTTQGKMKFSDFAKDSWVLLFSHPADFTPVCTTEMSGFAVREGEFTQLNTKLLGLSIDSIHSHLAWINSVNKSMGILIRFPIIADIDMKVAKLFGMIQPGESDTSAVRAVFYIDPRRKIKGIMYYPHSVGRNMDEIIRVLKALQVAEKHGVVLPLNWQPGDKVIVPPPKNVNDMIEREKSDYEMVDFYLAKRSV
ncbi:MAG: peroxiredoxin [Omnitrophica WOR_2 bacterium]|jgi:peroxiredoxin (alkyl hydroperoxide reductase subunit C)